jgi:hypothetical protein
VDPDENLKRQRELRAEIVEILDDEDGRRRAFLDDQASELADLHAGLDEWLSRGGALPRAWAR